jgi:hypothetical protein
VWELRREGSAWVRRQTAVIPLSRGVGSLAIDATGAPWIGAPLGYLPGAMAHFDGKRWQTIEEVAGHKVEGADVVGTTPDGRLWVRLDVAQDTGIYGYAQAATFDGTSWTLIGPPGGLSRYRLALAPDGSVWADGWWSAPNEPGPQLARYVADRWTLPYAGTSLPSMGLAAVAPDGTVFGSIASSFFRLPAASPPP